MKSEGCHAFDADKYALECTQSRENGIILDVYNFTIKSTSWDDRGKWECLYVQNTKSLDLDIRVSPIFDKLQVKPVVRMIPVKDALSTTNKVVYKLSGRGSRTNPYNLRDGTTVKIKCLSSCSYPETEHKWAFNNSTQAATELKSTVQRRRDICDPNTEKDMIASQSEVTVNCSILKMVGANVVRCSATSEPETTNSSVYVLCPGGERPWELTTGEMVGVAVSVAIFVILTVFMWLLLKRSRYGSVPQDGLGVKV